MSIQYLMDVFIFKIYTGSYGTMIGFYLNPKGAVIFFCISMEEIFFKAKN